MKHPTLCAIAFWCWLAFALMADRLYAVIVH